MKKELAIFTLALGLASTAPAFAGEQGITPKKQPVKMTDTQMDNVTGGQPDQAGLVNVCCIRVSNNDIVKNIQVSANAAVAVLGTAGAAGGNRGIVQIP
jgi:hypothetical protein